MWASAPTDSIAGYRRDELCSPAYSRRPPLQDTKRFVGQAHIPLSPYKKGLTSRSRLFDILQGTLIDNSCNVFDGANIKGVFLSFFAGVT